MLGEIIVFDHVNPFFRVSWKNNLLVKPSAAALRERPPLPCCAQPETRLPLCFDTDLGVLVSGWWASPAFFCFRWISHDCLRVAPWSHLPTLHHRWSKRLSVRPRHGSILGFCELMQGRFPWGGWLGSQESSSGQTSFLVKHLCE